MPRGAIKLPMRIWGTASTPIVFRVFRLHDRVAALHKIGPGILLDGLDGAVNKSKIFAVAPALFLVLINQKEAASQGFTIAHVADEADIPLGLSAAFFIWFLLKLFAKELNMPVRIRLPRDAFELEVLRGNLQPGGK